jgi:glycosyltransferase involved in cell wall biosynthesis
MHIAQIAPLKRYGGAERVICWLSEELVALGHEVTLCISCNSATSASLEALSSRVVHRVVHIESSVRDAKALDVSLLEQVREHSNRYDFLHFHTNNHPFSPVSRQGIPFVTTLHGRLDLPKRQRTSDTLSPPPAVSISNAQRRPVPQANWVRTIYHGMPQWLRTPAPAEPRYFAFLGCITPSAGVERAIAIARKCGAPARIAARIDEENREYFDDRIRPLLDGSSAEYIGEITDAEKSEFLSGAVALLDPAGSPEPFDLAMIEAMACGTPVIAFNRGAAPEIIDDGLTGFVVEDDEGAMEAFDQLSQLSRQKIRSRFEQRFTARQMALEYLDVYRALMDYHIPGFEPGADRPESAAVSPATGRRAVLSLKPQAERLCRSARSKRLCQSPRSKRRCLGQGTHPAALDFGD